MLENGAIVITKPCVVSVSYAARIPTVSRPQKELEEH